MITLEELEKRNEDKDVLLKEVFQLEGKIGDVHLLYDRTEEQCKKFMEMIYEHYNKICYVFSENREIHAKPISNPDHPKYMELARVLMGADKEGYIAKFILPFNTPNPIKGKVIESCNKHMYLTHAIDSNKRKIVLLS